MAAPLTNGNEVESTTGPLSAEQIVSFKENGCEFCSLLPAPLSSAPSSITTRHSPAINLQLSALLSNVALLL